MNALPEGVRNAFAAFQSGRWYEAGTMLLRQETSSAEAVKVLSRVLNDCLVHLLEDAQRAVETHQQNLRHEISDALAASASSSLGSAHTLFHAVTSSCSSNFSSDSADNLGSALGNSADFWHNYGRLFYITGDLETAMKYMQRALQLNSSHSAAKESLNNIMCAAIDRWHFSMLNDNNRNRSFLNAVSQVVEKFISAHGRPPRVLDIGAGTGLLAAGAVNSGAELPVHCCEVSPVMCAICRQCVEIFTQTSHKQESIVVWNDYSTNLDTALGSFDIVVTETADAALLGEGMLPTIKDACNRLLRPASTVVQTQQVIPSAARVFICGVSSCRLHRLGVSGGLAECKQFDRSVPYTTTLAYCNEGYTCNRFARSCDRIMTSTGEVCEWRFSTCGVDACHNTVLIPVLATGTIHCLFSWWEMQLSDSVSLGTSPFSKNNPEDSWEQAVYWLRPPIVVEDSSLNQIAIKSGKLVLEVQSFHSDRAMGFRARLRTPSCPPEISGVIQRTDRGEDNGAIPSRGLWSVAGAALPIVVDHSVLPIIPTCIIGRDHVAETGHHQLTSLPDLVPQHWIDRGNAHASDMTPDSESQRLDKYAIESLRVSFADEASLSRSHDLAYSKWVTQVIKVAFHDHESRSPTGLTQVSHTSESTRPSIYCLYIGDEWAVLPQLLASCNRCMHSNGAKKDHHSQTHFTTNKVERFGAEACERAVQSGWPIVLWVDCVEYGGLLAQSIAETAAAAQVQLFKAAGPMGAIMAPNSIEVYGCLFQSDLARKQCVIDSSQQSVANRGGYDVCTLNEYTSNILQSIDTSVGIPFPDWRCLSSPLKLASLHTSKPWSSTAGSKTNHFISINEPRLDSSDRAITVDGVLIWYVVSHNDKFKLSTLPRAPESCFDHAVPGWEHLFKLAGGEHYAESMLQCAFIPDEGICVETSSTASVDVTLGWNGSIPDIQLNVINN